MNRTVPAPIARRTRQRGIGIVGFIIGLVVGLAIALGVAVYVTKAPTPFTDKLMGKTAEQKASEEARLKAWDPNAGLQGYRGGVSGQVEPAAQQGASADAPPPIVNELGDTPAKGTTAPATARHAQQQPAATSQNHSGNYPEVMGAQEQAQAQARAEAQARHRADLKQQEAERAKARAEARARAQQAEARANKVQTDRANASADPIGTLAQERGAAAPARPHAPAQPAAANEPFVYFVQAGAFRDQGEADAQKARLSLMGFGARVTERDQAGRTVYRVRLGPFNSKADADHAKSRLDSNGVEAALVRVQR
ncbi:MAG: SPOR domain-containing protein [Brachymonas sp.]|uniref:SPOR domain-containing protein n=1 Tax=Brachymonas sp. M4Q-1 TaxID=3416906 RepID=UPI003CE958B6